MSSILRLTPSRELHGSLSVTVDSSHVLHVRRAIVQSGCRPVGIVKAIPLAGGTRVRMLIALAPELVRPVGEAIKRALAAESGSLAAD
jgi:hypothetical protein